MRVAVLAHSFPRFPGDTHGPFVQRLSEELAALGHRLHVLVPYDPELRGHPESPLTLHAFRYVWPDRWHLLGYSRTLRGDVHLKLSALLESPLYFLFAERALARLVRREGIELIHAHWALPNGYIAQRVARATGVPFAMTLHGSDVFMAERNPLFGAMARRAVVGAAHVTSCSGELRDRLLRVAGAEHSERILLVPNGTDLTPRQEEASAERVRRRLGLSRDERPVVAVGRMVHKKGFRFLIEAVPAIRERFPEARIVIGGGGDLLDEHRARVRRLGLEETVLFPGPLTHDEVLELIALAEVFVMPSVRDARGNVDGLPIVVLEAMAAAKPVVASGISGIPMAVRDGETGLLVPERDPAALAEAVSRLLASPEAVHRMGEAGRRRIEEELDWRTVARTHDRLYRRAVGEGEP